MKRHHWNALVLLSAALITAACSGIPRRERDQEQLDRYLRYAGPPVDHITYLGHYDNWQPVSSHQLVLWTGINDAYLITVRPPCENLQFSQRVGITQTANTISSKFDAVLVKGWRCPISEIRPIDYLRLRKDLREERARQKAEKPENAQP
jgi:Family of unknown function (DUF6491)